MISKISKLKNFGIFREFSWGAEDLPGFRKYNLIYGWNRSGKTTLSRIFASCEKKCVYDKDKFNQYPENGEFEVITSDGVIVKNTDVATNALPIKVFNQDFIDENISFDPLDSCNPIVYVSEQDIENKKQLDRLRLDKGMLDQALNQVKKDKVSKESLKVQFLRDLAREVANTLGYDRTKYQAPGVESKINSIGLSNFTNKILSDDDRKKYDTISKGEAGKIQNILHKLPLVDLTFLYTRVKSLLEKKVISELLERLKDPEDIDGGLDEDLNDWVKRGFDIHKTKNQFRKCLFCENDFSSNLFDSLSKHFSKDYEELQFSVEFLLKDLREEKLGNISENNFELDSDLRVIYVEESQKYNEIIKRQNDWLLQSEMWLEQKYKNPFDSDIPGMVNDPENYTNLLNEIIDKLNSIILEHNLRSNNHNEEVIDAKEKLELHLIAIALTDQDYRKIIIDLEEASKKEKEVFESVNKNDLEISALEQKTSDISLAIPKINKHLKEFFGREGIELQLNGNNNGYTIRRDKQPAKNLSEGEKTAIAFSYFVVRVEEKGSKIKDQIIFIDDPISSFDSNFIYHCFALIKNHFGEVGQMFISTHNFQLFNLVKDWFTRKNRNIEEENRDRKIKEKQGKELSCEFYMVQPGVNKEYRESKLVTLDPTLRNYKSEYAFLFSLLDSFNRKIEEPTFEEIYNVANIGRRFFDIFADFKIPTNNKDPKEKIDILIDEINNRKEKEGKIDEKISRVTADKIFWLINSFSHNSDPTSAIEHKDKSESKDVINMLLNIVKESDPIHFEILRKYALERKPQISS